MEGNEKITVNKLHTDEMVKQEMKEMLGASDFYVTLGMVEGLWVIDSPYITGGDVTEDDLKRAMTVCCAEGVSDPVAWHKSLVNAIETAIRPYETIVPEAKPETGVPKVESEVPIFSPEWLADTLNCATDAMPSLTLHELLWEVPMTLVSHLAVSTARRNGATTRRPDDVSEAIKIFKERKKANKENENA